MIVKFDKCAVVRSSEINYAHLVDANTPNPKLHINCKGGDIWLEIHYDSLEKAEKELDRLAEAMEAGEGITKPKKKVARRKIR